MCSALLVSDVRNPFFADIAHAAEQAALGADYVSLLGNANENVDQQDRYIETFLTQRVDGVVLAPQGRDRAASRRSSTADAGGVRRPQGGRLRRAKRDHRQSYRTRRSGRASRRRRP